MSALDLSQGERLKKRRGRCQTPRDGRAGAESENLDAVALSSVAAQWISSMAVLGDSCGSLIASVLLLLVALAISFLVDHDMSVLQNQVLSFLDVPLRTLDWKRYVSNDPYDQLGSVQAIDPPKIFDVADIFGSEEFGEKVVKAYRKDGMVAIRGLVDDELMAELDVESGKLVEDQKRKNFGKKQKQTQFFTNVHGAMFRNYNFTSSLYKSAALTNPFLRVSLTSLVPKLAAELLQSTGNLGGHSGYGNTLRVMRDIFLAKDVEQYVCGWHVDDLGFWPATPDAPGVNAWIALDDMPLEHGGGFALAVGSHSDATSPWRHEALEEIGATTSFPPEGYKSASDMIARRTGGGTCNIKRGAPHLHRRLEETKRVYEIKRGDVIFHDRWLFHRTIPFDTIAFVQQAESPIYRRYSVRYSPGTATVPPGYGTELSVLYDPINGGRSADEASRIHPWYPQAWPKPLDREVSALTELVQNVMPHAEKRKIERQKEMKPLIQKLAQRNDRQHARDYYSRTKV